MQKIHTFNKARNKVAKYIESNIFFFFFKFKTIIQVHISATIRAAPDNETVSDDAPAGIFIEQIIALRVELLYNGSSTTFFSECINFAA